VEGTRARSAVVKGFDSANYLLDTDGGALFRNLYAAGYRVYVPHLLNWPPATTKWDHLDVHTAAALEAGLHVAGYCRNATHWSQALDAAESALTAAGRTLADLRFFTIDIENSTDATLDPPLDDARLRVIVDGVRACGVTVVLYTSVGMWPGAAGTSLTDSFSDLPLWDNTSEVPPNPVTLATHHATLTTPTPQVYGGGWNAPGKERFGQQQALSISYGTTSPSLIDLDAFDLSLLDRRAAEVTTTGP
jgi:hypothetical protein